MTLPRDLILVPTELERGFLTDSDFPSAQIAVCGFGMISSGIQTTRLILQDRPTRVWLTGIAGALTDRLKVGQAYHFEAVQQYGIGVGSGERFVPASKLGWEHLKTPVGMSIGDRIDLSVPSTIAPSVSPLLLTVSASAADKRDTELRASSVPVAEAEDMEAFSVAMSCRLENIEVCVIRGISNIAGNRDHSTWKIENAMQRASELLRLAISSSTDSC